MTMADTKENVHEIRGYIPKEAWAEFIKKHFVTGEAEEHARRAQGAGGICASLGCPSRHPISGSALNGCRVVTERDGSTTIYCTYEPIARL
jgi:hypothetical protein